MKQWILGLLPLVQQLLLFRRSPDLPTDGPGLGDFADALFSDSLVSVFARDASERFYTAFASGDLTLIKHPLTHAWRIQVQGKSAMVSLRAWAKDVYPDLVQAELDALLAQQQHDDVRHDVTHRERKMN